MLGCWWRSVVADQGRQGASCHVGFPACLKFRGGGASGLQRWLLLNVGERSYRADAVRRRPPGGGGSVLGGGGLQLEPLAEVQITVSLSDWLTVRSTHVLSGPLQGHAMPWPRHAMPLPLSLLLSLPLMCVCMYVRTVRYAHRGRDEMGAWGLRPSLCRPTDRPQGRSDVMTLARQVVCFFCCVFCVASGPWGNTRLRHVIF